jgi:hypothetical protein
MDDLQEALRCYTRSLQMRPDYAEAAHWKMRVEARLQGEAFVSAAAQADADLEHVKQRPGGATAAAAPPA